MKCYRLSLIPFLFSIVFLSATAIGQESPCSLSEDERVCVHHLCSEPCAFFTTMVLEAMDVDMGDDRELLMFAAKTHEYASGVLEMRNSAFRDSQRDYSVEMSMFESILSFNDNRYVDSTYGEIETCDPIFERFATLKSVIEEHVSDTSRPRHAVRMVREEILDFLSDANEICTGTLTLERSQVEMSDDDSENETKE